MLVLPIAGSDIVIGASWLATLGPHVADYTIESAKLQFLYESSFTLRGSTGPTVAWAELHHLQRYVNTNAISELNFLQYDLHVDTDINELTIPSNTLKKFRALIGKYQHIYH